ncbi:hypothetical protein PQJ73_03025 [Rhodoplanes tepidamans]|uniref:Phasin domain-containing protein n=1 Tax=Rhodoplanes tepidamans TaxID=200616 RepID=A0ABT5J4S9_RHOTP|nr:hypothetical protein [Rhodoplanes tepidamans]MDC7784645.1 hypothetical protein [Rhodoplanes tepidamans]
MDQHAPLEHSVETVPPPIVLAPEEAPSSVPGQTEPMSDASAIGQWVPTPTRRAASGRQVDLPATPGGIDAALGLTARAGADLFGQNAAMAQRLLAAGAEMTTHMNACARAHFDLVARSNAELMAVAMRASNDWSAWTRRYVEYIAGDRMTAFLRHRTPQHLALFQAEAFNTGVETMLGWARVAAERAAAETRAAATRAGTDRTAA